MNEWISAEKELPEKNKDVLTYPQYIRTRWDGSGWKFVWRKDSDMQQGYILLGPVTHWMPLPEPPEPELKPCPFCGSDVVKLELHEQTDNFYVMCQCCSATGSMNHRKVVAITFWNNCGRLES